MSFKDTFTKALYGSLSGVGCTWKISWISSLIANQFLLEQVGDVELEAT